MYGDSFRGVGYTRSANEAQERYALMLEVIRERDAAITILDLGVRPGPHARPHREPARPSPTSGTRVATSRPRTLRRRSAVTRTRTWTSSTYFARMRASASTTTS